jgi:multidrug resistance efflux pump
MIHICTASQRLTLDKVSLEAAVTNANANLGETARKLDAVVAEIGELQGQMRTLREQLEQAQKNQAGVQVRDAVLSMAMAFCATQASNGVQVHYCGSSLIIGTDPF